jgi:hypothetical protein
MAEELVRILTSAYNDAAVDGVEAVRDYVKVARQAGIGFIGVDELEVVLTRIQELFRKEQG